LKIGLFGGTFNPIHYGHLINAQMILEDHSLSKIIFIPSKYPVHKSLDGNATEDDRFNMTCMAVESSGYFSVSRIELDRETPSYTIITVKKILEEYTNSEIFLIIGSDSYNEIEIWKDYKNLLEIVNIVVLNRPGSKCIEKKFDNKSYNIGFADNPLIGISSSMIRERIGKGKSIRYLVPESVEEYIEKKGLYKK
jgi:nicotinate-nucleotide adenylyltransferase